MRKCVAGEIFSKILGSCIVCEKDTYSLLTESNECI